MANKIAITAIALIMVVSAVSVVATADTNSGQQPIKLGNYSFSDNTSTSAILNLSYKTDSGNSLIAKSIDTMGNSAALSLPSGSDSNSIVLNNVTVTSAGSENVILFSTVGSQITGNPTMAFNLNTNVSQVNLTSNQYSYLQNHSSRVLTDFVSHPIYDLLVNGTTFYLFSNANSTATKDSVTYHDSTILLGSKLIVGLSSANGIKDRVEKEMEHHKSASPFTYNNTTGQLTGRFVSMQYNATAGTIYNYMDSMGNMTIFNSISAAGNGSIGNTYLGPVFPTLQPIVAGSVFYYSNNTVVYQMHDNPAMVSNYYLSNGTLTMNVSSGLNVSTYNPPKEDVSHQSLPANFSTNVDLGDQYDVQSSSTIVFLHNNTFTGSIFVNGANVSVNGSSVSISTNQTAHITFVAPPGLQKVKRSVESDLQYGINHGKLAAVLVLGAPGQSSSNVSVNYNGSMQIAVQNVTANKVLLKVSSKMHEGNNFAIFVPNNVIQNNSKITVKFDNQTITLTSGVGSVINATSTTQASFYYVTTNGGTLVVIHVPHFSTHSIEIVNSAVSPSSPSGSMPNGEILYIGLGIVAVIAVIAGVSLTRRKR
ncbi:hypothetical protein IX51_08125 [uncultured archaeon]|nr:hypothetical protein IX51_08125 [uncultured archaeon]